MLKHRSWLLALLLATASLAQASQPDVVGQALDNAIARRSDVQKARDGARHPAETLTFMQVAPGQTVAELLPGGGWYTRILANYLGAEGTLYGLNYAERMWPLFGFFSEERIAERIASTGKFAGQVADFTDNGIQADGFTVATVPSEVAGTVDRVLMIRGLHNLNRFEAQAGTLSQALAATRAMLKDDGLVGVVQHRLPESASDDKADGSRGYLKQSTVIAAFEKAGFELVASSEINANPKDQPGPDDMVWRLPPSLNGSKDNPEQRAAIEAIGESDRMTLLFKKAS
jgi:predicted methyltransferase